MRVKFSADFNKDTKTRPSRSSSTLHPVNNNVSMHAAPVYSRRDRPTTTRFPPPTAGNRTTHTAETRQPEHQLPGVGYQAVASGRDTASIISNKRRQPSDKCWAYIPSSPPENPPGGRPRTRRVLRRTPCLPLCSRASPACRARSSSRTLADVALVALHHRPCCCRSLLV